MSTCAYIQCEMYRGGERHEKKTRKPFQRVKLQKRGKQILRNEEGSVKRDI